ncbi:MAG: chloride channel protein [Clostridia bacterium]|nr:chloride channel protein [Clostridia bacterium]
MTGKNYFLHTMVPTLFYGTITGIITGAVIWLYQFLAEKMLEYSSQIYNFVRDNLAFLPLLIVGLIIAALLSYFNTKLVPEVKGGGVPYAEGASRGLLPIKWYKVAPAAMFGSLLSFFCGLPLGSEGPSVLIGGAVGSGVNLIGGKYHKRHKTWERVSISSGASAGFATALNAPLAGILLALEECQKKFSPVVLAQAAVSVLFALITASLLRIATGMHEHALFSFNLVEIGLSDMYLPLIVGVVTGLAGVAFLKLLSKSIKLMNSVKLPQIAKVIAAFLLSGAACLFFADMIGGGAGLINKVGNMALEWQIILVLLILKLFLIIFCSSSSITGGMFIPYLCVGALLGGLLAKIMVACGMGQVYYSTIVVISMCAFLCALLQAPITAIVLIVELAGGMTSLFPSIIAIVAAYLITGLFHAKPVYDEMLENILEKRHAGKEVKNISFEISIGQDAYAIGKTLKFFLLPHSVTSVTFKNPLPSGAKPDHFRRGERIICEGDVLVVAARTIDEEMLKHNVKEIFGETDVLDVDA